MKKLNREVKELKGKLLFFERLAILGRIILCSADELNTFMEEIRDLLSMIQDKESDLVVRERYLTEALETLDKMSLIIKSWLSYSNPPQ